MVSLPCLYNIQITLTQESRSSAVLKGRSGLEQEPAALRDFSPVYVRFGSKADAAACFGHVRFTPESGHQSARRECPLCANSGQMHRNKRRARIVEIYSVTSSRDRTPAISRNGRLWNIGTVFG